MKKFRIIFPVVILLLVTSAFQTPTDRYFDIMKNIEIFSNVYKELNSNFVDDLDPSKLMKVGIDAMVESLDPYTNYISEAQIESYRISSEGSYNGIGASSKMINGWVTVTEVYEGGSAEEAGLKAGDQIIEINGQSTKGRSNEDVMQILKGFPGSEVKLGLNRAGKGKLELDLSRSEINIPNVPYSGSVAEGVGYIALTTFTQNAGANVAKALKSLKRDSKNDLKGVILDLRGNGGGLLMEALSVSNVFIDQGKEVVATKGKIKEQDRIFKTNKKGVDLEIPLVVLINNRSASASEIVCGVIQDYDRGVLLGQRSYGKGLVQNTLQVGYNSQLKVTISKYYIPSGRCIQSVEYENGAHIDIPDEKRTVFYTENGRPVLDGGGVTPDNKIDHENTPEILKQLLKENWIFNYVTDYCKDLDSIPIVKDFSFEDYKGFKKYLKNNSFDFKTETEIELDKFMTDEDQSQYNSLIQKDIRSIYKKIEAAKNDDLDEFEKQIVTKIENEIITRYYFQRGKIEHRLKNDLEVQKAVELLNDPVRYTALLKGK